MTDQAADFVFAPVDNIWEVTAEAAKKLHDSQERVEQDYRKHNNMLLFIAGMTEAMAEMRLTVDRVIANNTILTKNNKAFQQRILELELQQEQLRQDCARATARLQELDKPNGPPQGDADDDSAFDDPYGAGNNDDSYNYPILYAAPAQLGQSQLSSSSSLHGLEDRFGQLGNVFDQQPGSTFGPQQFCSSNACDPHDLAGQLGTGQPGGMASQLGTVLGQPGGMAGQLGTAFGQQQPSNEAAFGQQLTQSAFGQPFGQYGMANPDSQLYNTFDQPASGLLDNSVPQPQETEDLVPDLFMRGTPAHQNDMSDVDNSRHTDPVSPKRAKIAEPGVVCGNGVVAFALPAVTAAPAPLVTSAALALSAVTAPLAPLVAPAPLALSAVTAPLAPLEAPAPPAPLALSAVTALPVPSESATPTSTSSTPTSPAGTVSSLSPLVEAAPPSPPPAVATVATAKALEVKIVIDTPANLIHPGWIHHGEWVVYNRRAKIDDVRFHKAHVYALIAGRLVHPRWHQRYIDIMDTTHDVAEASQHLAIGGRWLRDALCANIVKTSNLSYHLDMSTTGRAPPEWCVFLNRCLRIDNVNGVTIGAEDVCQMVTSALRGLFVRA